MRKLLLVALLSIACASGRTVRRSMIANGERIGTSVVTWNADGTITNMVDVHNNGRGPHADSVMRLAPDGTIASLDAKGHTELNAPVDEHFSIAGGKAAWRGNQENGEKAVSGAAFYVPNSATDTNAFMLAALQKNGGTLQLLPGGTARLRQVGDVTVGGAHYLAQEITGISFTPNYLWTRDDGSYFAEVFPGFWFGEEGKEAALDPLVKKQEEIRKARDKAIADRLAHMPPAAGFALTHARVLDVEKGAWIPDQTVIVRNGVIERIGGAPPAGAEVIDLQGKALLPGLWDMHAHLGPADGPLNIASGVTTVRDVGNRTEYLDDVRVLYDEGKAVGPHVYRSGFIEGKGKDAARAEVTASNPEEAQKAVEFFQKRGYEGIKIYNSVDPALVPVLAKEAHARGMSVTGHIPHGMLANEAVRAGYDGVEHINQLLLNFFATHETETRTPLRFSLVGDKAADFDFRSPQAKEFWTLLREHKTVIDPTLVTFEQVYVYEQGKLPEGWGPTVARLPAQVQRGFLTGGLPFEGGKKELYARSWDKMVSIPKVLHDEGVTVVAGTDFYAGVGLHRELELFVQGGLSAADALRDATIVPARVMKAEAKSGTIAEGKVADLVVIDGDPLANISDIRKTVFTLRSGVMYPAKELYETVGVSQ